MIKETVVETSLLFIQGHPVIRIEARAMGQEGPLLFCLLNSLMSTVY